MIIAASIGMGLLLAVVLFRTFFEGLDDFLECIRYYLTPDILSAFRGELHEDWWAEWKLFIYFGVCAAGGFLTYYWLQKLAGS